MQSHWGFICSSRLFLTFANLTLLLINTRTFVKTNNKCKKYENSFEQVFHLPSILRNVQLSQRDLEILFIIKYYY